MLQRGAVLARKAVAHPQEGTILSVADAAARAGRVAADAGASIVEVAEAARDAASAAGFTGCSAAHAASSEPRRRLSRTLQASPSSPIARAKPASIAFTSVAAVPWSEPALANHFSARSTTHAQPPRDDEIRSVPYDASRRDSSTTGAPPSQRTLPDHCPAA